MSHDARRARPSSSRPRPSIDTSPAIATTRRAVISSKALAPPSSRAQAIEAVVAEDLAGDTVAGAAAPGAHDEHQLAVGHRAQEPLDERGAEEAGRARDRDAFAGKALPNQRTVPFVYRVGSSGPCRAGSRVECLPNGRHGCLVWRGWPRSLLRCALTSAFSTWRRGRSAPGASTRPRSTTSATSSAWPNRRSSTGSRRSRRCSTPRSPAARPSSPRRSTARSSGRRTPRTASRSCCAPPFASPCAGPSCWVSCAR